MTAVEIRPDPQLRIALMTRTSEAAMVKGDWWTARRAQAAVICLYLDNAEWLAEEGTGAIARLADAQALIWIKRAARKARS